MAAVLMGLSWSLQVSSTVPQMVAAPAGKVTWGICKKHLSCFPVLIRLMLCVLHSSEFGQVCGKCTSKSNYPQLLNTRVNA